MLKAVATVCISALVALTLGDIIFWRMAPIYLNDAISVRFEQNLPGLKGEILYTENAFGLRSISMKTRAKPDNSVRILALGASTTQQMTQGITDTWSGTLETLLNQAFMPQTRIEVAAYGRGGYRARDVLDWARTNLDRYDPDIVVLLLGINDLALNGGAEYQYGGRHELEQNPAKHTEKKKGSLITVCLEYSQICRRLRALKHRLYPQQDGKREVEWHSENLSNLRREYSNLPMLRTPERHTDPIGEFSDATAMLIEKLSEMEIQVLVLGQPVLWKDSMTTDEINTLWLPINTMHGPARVPTGWLYREMLRYNAVQAKTADRFNTPYLDLDEQIDKNLENYFDDCHFTDIGSRRVAMAIFPIVRDQVASVLRNHKPTP